MKVGWWEQCEHLHCQVRLNLVLTTSSSRDQGDFVETGGVARVFTEQQWHSDAIQACPGKEMKLYYRSLIILSKRRYPLEEA